MDRRLAKIAPNHITFCRLKASPINFSQLTKVEPKSEILGLFRHDLQ